MARAARARGGGHAGGGARTPGAATEAEPRERSGEAGRARALVREALAAVCARTGVLLLERPQKLFGVFIAGRRGGANGTKRGHDLRLHGTLSVGQNAPRIRIGCRIPKVRVEPTEPVDRVGELIELPSHIHLQSAVR
jgi:hypothetical protein